MGGGGDEPEKRRHYYPANNFGGLYVGPTTNATANGKTRVIQNKGTECEPSQFGNSRERIAADNEEICNATTENVERAASTDPPLTV